MSHEWDEHLFAKSLTAGLEAEAVTVWLDANNMQGDITVEAQKVHFSHFLVTYPPIHYLVNFR